MDTIPIQSRKRNRYFYDPLAKKMVLCHPVMFHLLELAREGKDLDDWISRLGDEGIEIKGCGTVSKQEIGYYYQKYSILKENGYFQERENQKKLVFQMTADDVKRSLANSPQVTFEVTDRCGLACGYCGYGKLYNDYDKRDNSDMSVVTVRSALDYLVELWNSPLNLSHDRNIYIGFYGGEPLLNFPLLRDAVEYVKGLKVRHNRFTFSITTNGLLLDKYMDFLVQNDFNVLISLDGDETSTAYRVYKNGKPAYQDIMKNIANLKSRYPVYFEEKVNFNAVLHNLNSVSGIYSFFKTTFNKIPGISSLSTSGIAKDQEKLFRETYMNVEESLYQSEDYSIIEKDMFLNLPTTRALSLFIHQDNDCVFYDYNRLIYPEGTQMQFPTGTCTPFSKKIYVTVNGKILPCERIGHQYMLGRVTAKDGIIIDYSAIARKYTAYFSKMKNQCTACHNSAHCTQCVFNLNDLEGKPVCNGIMTKNDQSRQFSSYLDYIEDDPYIYTKLLKETIME